QALLLAVDLRLVPDAFGFRRGRLGQLAIGAVLCHVTHGLVGPVGINAQVAAEEVGVGVFHRELFEVVELGQRAGDGALFSGVGGRVRAFDRVEAAAFHRLVVVLAADVEIAVAGLDALHLAFAEVVAALHEQVLAVRIGQRAGGVQANAAAVAVVGDATVDVRAADQEVGGIILVGVHHADLGLRAVVLELAAVTGGHGGLVTVHFRVLGEI